MTTPIASIVVPAHNDARFLPGLLASLEAMRGDKIELIVVDNGSTDGSAALLAASGAMVITLADRINPSTARNRGVAVSNAPVLVFLDADVVVTRQWAAACFERCARLRAEPMTIAGEQYHLSTDPGWIEHWWFGPMRQQPKSYVNGGNLLTTRVLFDAVGGFDESLETGEDVDRCGRAVAAGARIVLDDALVVHHEGFPKSVHDFVRRERWHGQGDVRGLADLLRSKIALLSVAYLASHVVLVASAIRTASGVPTPLGFASSSAVIGGICIVSGFHRFRRVGPRYVIPGIAISYLYFAGRALSLVDAVSAWVRRIVAGRRKGGMR